MIMHSDKKVICIKDIPSNIIEEAIFILKSNDSTCEVDEEKNRTIILSEAEKIVEEYVSKMENSNDIENENISNNSWIKEIVYVVGLLIILAICIFIVI